jgi:hypothetical protein
MLASFSYSFVNRKHYGNQPLGLKWELQVQDQRAVRDSVNFS